MKQVTAKLVGLRTGDGYWNFKVDKATIGKEYTIDVDRIGTHTFWNTTFKVYHKSEVVWALDEGDGNWYPFPTELLEFKRPCKAGKRRARAGRR